MYEKKYTAIGFKSDSGGYELRNQFFKGSSSPKDITFLNHGQQKNLAVFEGFFNYLSFHSIRKNHFVLTNFFVLNSASFFEKSREKMEAHQEINLFLDTDPAGKKLTQLALQWDKGKYMDRSHLYQNQKDLNEWLVHKNTNQSKATGYEGIFEVEGASYVLVKPKLLAPFMLPHSGRNFSHAIAFEKLEERDYGGGKNIYKKQRRASQKGH